MIALTIITITIIILILIFSEGHTQESYYKLTLGILTTMVLFIVSVKTLELLGWYSDFNVILIISILFGCNLIQEIYYYYYK